MSDLSISSGSINIDGGELHEVVRVIKHEGYNPNNSYDADIAILEVTFICYHRSWVCMETCK